MLETIAVFVLVGFIAQLIDGALGMLYGITSTTFLLSLGITPAIASASVHSSEIVTSGISGFFHMKFGNIDKELFRKLLLPGIAGGIIGAYVLTAIPGKELTPFVSLYLLAVGLMVLRKALDGAKMIKVKTKLAPLGFAGGFLDAIGGGGWGPIVTSTLIARGNSPRFAIGSVNLVEFFVTVAEAATFFMLIGLVHWQIILGLIIGGALAAPLAAYVCKKLPAKALMTAVGVLIILLSLRTLYEVLA